MALPTIVSLSSVFISMEITYLQEIHENYISLFFTIESSNLILTLGMGSEASITMKRGQPLLCNDPR
jgi:hypothetical protein